MLKKWGKIKKGNIEGKKKKRMPENGIYCRKKEKERKKENVEEKENINKKKERMVLEKEKY